MRILAANKYHYVRGGSDRYFFELAQAQRDRGHVVIPFSVHHRENVPTEFDRYFLSPVNYWEEPSLIEKVHGATRMFYSVQARRQMARLIAEQHPEIAHIHLIYHQMSPSFLPLLKDRSIPIVQTLHDYKPVCPTYSLRANGQNCERCQGKNFYHAVLQACNKGSRVLSAVSAAESYVHRLLGWYELPDVYIAPSMFMKQKLAQLGMPEGKIVHIPNFVDTRRIVASDPRGDYFAYIGRLVTIKGVGTLLRAMTLIAHRSARLKIVGDGPERGTLMQYARSANMKNVEFVGHVSGSQLDELVGRALFTVLPSEVYENCPMAVLEAMAMAKPVVGSRIGGIPELIVDGETGLLFPAGDAEALASALDAMLSNPARVQSMGMAARQRAEQNYGVQHHYDQIMAAYRLAAERAGGSDARVEVDHPSVGSDLGTRRVSFSHDNDVVHEERS